VFHGIFLIENAVASKFSVRNKVMATIAAITACFAVPVVTRRAIANTLEVDGVLPRDDLARILNLPVMATKQKARAWSLREESWLA